MPRRLDDGIGGLVRLPAAWTGSRPSSPTTALDNASSDRSANPLAHTVADVALGMYAVARYDECDDTSLSSDDIGLGLPYIAEWVHPEFGVKGSRVWRRTRRSVTGPYDTHTCPEPTR